MPSISVRALDANYNPTYGNGQGNFLYDIDAVIQIVQTRLRLLQGEWWADLADGLPAFQKILVPGAGRNPEAVSLLIQQRILGTPYVTSVQNIQTSYNGTLRSFKFSCQVITPFGVFVITFAPGQNAALTN
jgi:hypothetical protein